MLVVNANTHAETTRFKTLSELRAWLLRFEQGLTAEQWQSDGPPQVLADGWPDTAPKQ